MNLKNQKKNIETLESEKKYIENALKQKSHESDYLDHEYKIKKREVELLTKAQQENNLLINGFKEHISLLIKRSDEQLSKIDIKNNECEELHRQKAKLEEEHAKLEKTISQQKQQLITTRQDIENINRQLSEQKLSFEEKVIRKEKEIETLLCEKEKAQADLQEKIERQTQELLFFSKTFDDFQHKTRQSEEALQNIKKSLDHVLYEDIKHHFTLSKWDYFLVALGIKNKQSILPKSFKIDEDWYKKTYQDVNEKGISAVKHFTEHGYKEKRKINSFWSKLLK